MVAITIGDALSREIVEAGSPAILVDSNGLAVAHVTSIEQSGPIGMTDEHLAELKRRIANDDGTRYTWPQVLQHLRSLAPE